MEILSIGEWLSSSLYAVLLSDPFFELIPSSRFSWRFFDVFWIIPRSFLLVRPGYFSYAGLSASSVGWDILTPAFSYASPCNSIQMLTSTETNAVCLIQI